jgi:beta-xylosidase
MYHAYHPKDFVYVGRQGMLDEVRWNADGWPTINDGRGPGGTPATARNTWSKLEHSFFDDFNTSRLRPVWQWPQANEPVVSIAPARQGWLTLTSPREQGEHPLGAVLARPTTRGDYTATTMVDTRGMKGGTLAGLSAYGDSENALGASVGIVYVWRREKNEQRILTTTDVLPASSIYLRMRARDGHLYRFSTSRDGRNWTDAGEEIDGAYLPPWDRGVRVALTAGGVADASARFAFLRVEPSR